MTVLRSFFGLTRRGPGILILGAVLWLGATNAHARPLDDIVEDGTIIIAVYREFPPFAYHRDGELVGVDVDLARLIAERLGVDVSLMLVTADETMDDDLRNVVWKGHYFRREVADLMLHVPIDRQLALRNNLTAFFAPYFRREFALAYDPEWIDIDPNPVVFMRENVGVERDSLPCFYRSSAYGRQLRKNVVHYPNVQAAVHALVEGEVAGVMAPQSQIEAALGPDAERFSIGPANMTGFGQPTWVVGVEVDHNSRDLGYAVEDIITAGIADGNIERIFSSHGVSYRSPTDDAP